MTEPDDPTTAVAEVVHRREPDGFDAKGAPYWWNEPFTVGNQAAVRHGAWSPRHVDPIAAELIEAVRPSATWLTAVDEPALHAWARAEAQVQLLTEYLTAAAEITEDGVGDLEADRVKSAYLLLHRAEARADTGRKALGLTPLARARLGRDVAASRVDLASLMADEAERLAVEGGGDVD